MSKPIRPLKNYEEAIFRFSKKWTAFAYPIKTDEKTHREFRRAFEKFHMSWIWESSKYGNPYNSELASLIIDIAVAFNTPPFLFSNWDEEKDGWTDYAKSHKEKEAKFSTLIDELVGTSKIHTIARHYERDCFNYSWIISHHSKSRPYTVENEKQSFLLAHPGRTEEDFTRDVLGRIAK